jgi:hypothetical protein
MAAKFGVKLAGNGEYYFNLIAEDGDILFSSELYKAKSGAENGVASVKKNAADLHRYEKQTLDNGRFRFVIKAGNGQVVGHSPMYAVEQDRDNLMTLVHQQAPNAKVVDLTDAAPL